MAELPLVSVITVNFRQAELTCALLQSLSTCVYPRLEVIVVDNGCLEDKTSLFLQHYPTAQVILSPENLGFAGGNNLGLARATGDYLFLINNDAEVLADTIGQLVHRMQHHPTAGMLGPKIRYFDRPHLIQYAGFTEVHPVTARNRTIGQGEEDHGQYDQFRAIPYAHGAAMMISRAAMERVGPMPEVYFLYYEELDWCRQLQRAGFGIFFEPQALVYHKESVSVGAHSPLQTYYLNRNRLLFMRRNAAWWSLAAFCVFFALVTTPRWLLTYFLKRQPIHLRAFVKAIKWHLRPTWRPKDPVSL